MNPLLLPKVGENDPEVALLQPASVEAVAHRERRSRQPDAPEAAPPCIATDYIQNV